MGKAGNPITPKAILQRYVLKLDKDAPYLITCGSGGRSTKALTTLEELGFTNVTHLDGGMKDWHKAELPVKTPE